jgi:phytoene/squalene synthetase
LKNTACDLRSFKDSVYPEKFQELMRLEADRAQRFYLKADELAEGAEKKNLLSAFIMGQVYRDLLAKMERRAFRTAGDKIGLNGFEKSRAVYRAWIKTRA